MYIKFSKVRDVKTPKRANYTDAGVDFFIPSDFLPTAMQHGDSVLIPSGIKVEVPVGFALIFHNKSGIASKKNLFVGASVCDAGYSGEVHINIINNGPTEQWVHPGDKIIQGILIQVPLIELLEVSEEDLYKDILTTSGRGSGGFGSSGTK